MPYMVDDDTGWLYPPGDVGSLASILQEALKNPARLEKMGKNARGVAKKYHPVVIADEYRKAYEILVSRKRSKN
jgi:glycosyltransferase involved in cell wall biosynthesis